MTSETALPATLPVPEAARLLGVSRATAYRAVARGDLPTLRLGGRVLVLRRPLERLLQGEEPAPEARRGR